MNINIFDNDLFSIQEARILAERAKAAQSVLASYSQKKLDEIVHAMAIGILPHIGELANLSCEETDYGNCRDKYIKNKFICEYVIKNMQKMRCVGIIAHDSEKGMTDIGIPVGVIAALCPVTSPVSTTIYKSLIAVKSGNAVVFSPHPRAVKTMAKTLDILVKSGKEAGLPEGILSYMRTVTKVGTVELMKHKDVSMIMNTGIMSLLKEASMSGKPLIFGGVGSGPAFVEGSADIRQAAEDIVMSKSFDNGTLSASEQSVVVDKVVKNSFRLEFIKAGAYFMTDSEAEAMGKLLYRHDGTLNPMTVGKDAQFLAAKAGFQINENVKVLVSEQKYVSETNPYSKEKLCPVISYYVEEDWQNACEKCIELLLTERYGHTLVIHSEDPFIIEQFALKKPVGRILVNTPATYGSMGATTNLFPAMTLGSGSAGKGITSDNVSPMNLIYIRKVGYGIRNAGQMRQECEYISGMDMTDKTENQENKINMRKLRQIFEDILREIKQKT